MSGTLEPVFATLRVERSHSPLSWQEPRGKDRFLGTKTRTYILPGGRRGARKLWLRRVGLYTRLSLTALGTRMVYIGSLHLMSTVHSRGERGKGVTVAERSRPGSPCGRDGMVVHPRD